MGVDSSWVKCTLRLRPEMLELQKKGGLGEPGRERRGNSANPFAPVNAPGDAPLTELQRSLLNLIKEDNRISYEAMAAKVQKNRSTIMRNIRTLKESGTLKHVGSDKTGHWELEAK